MDFADCDSPLCQALTGGVGLLFAYQAFAYWQSRSRARALQRQADAARAKRDAAIQRFLDSDAARSMDEARVRELTEGVTASDLVHRLREGQLSSEEVVTAHCIAAARAAQRLTCAAEVCFEEALEQAREVDAARARGERAPEKLLLGLPVSIKDMFAQRGFVATSGTAALATGVFEEDGLLVELLRDQGVIPFVRSNIPQSLMLPESDNNVWGRCLNPHDPARAPGGSSGGEGALVAAFASPLGLGSDIGGSIRIPAAFCGVTGFKPTPMRTTTKGFVLPRVRSVSGQEGIQSVAGPLARCVDDCALMMRCLWARAAFEGDPLCAPLAFDTATYSTPRHLRFGVIESLDWFPASAPCRRAVRDTAARLRDAGHEASAFELPDAVKAIHAVYKILTADGGRAMLEGLKGEDPIQAYKTLIANAKLPRALRPLVARLLRSVVGEGRVAGLVQSTGARSAFDYWEAICDRKETQAAVFAAMKEQGIDALLLPVTAVPAFKHGYSEHLNSAVCYTMLFNLLHMPAGVVPAARVRPDEDGVYHDAHNDRWTRLARDNMAGAAGLPVGVQVATLPYRDELCLNAMKVVEGVVDYH